MPQINNHGSPSQSPVLACFVCGFSTVAISCYVDKTAVTSANTAIPSVRCGIKQRRLLQGSQRILPPGAPP